MIDFVSNNNNSIAEFFDVANGFVNYGTSWLGHIQGVAKPYTSLKSAALKIKLSIINNTEFILRANKNKNSNLKKLYVQDFM